MKDEVLVIRLEKEVKALLKVLADNEGRSLSNYVHKLLTDKAKAELKKK